MFFNTIILIKNKLFGYSVQRKDLKPNNLITYFFITFLSIIILQCYPSNSWGYQKKIDEIKFSLDSKDMTIEEICEKIYERTKYKILLNGPILQKKISLEAQDSRQSEVIATLIKRAGVTNYTIATDNKNRTIRINTYESGSYTTLLPKKGGMEKKDITENEIEPGFSYKDMEKVTSEYNEQKKNLKLSDEVEPGFTYKNMEDAIKKYNEQKQNVVATGEVEPGFTYKDMENATKKYQERTKHIK